MRARISPLLGDAPPPADFLTDEQVADIQQTTRRTLSEIWDLDLLNRQQEQATVDRLEALQAERNQQSSTRELTRFSMVFAAGLAALVAGAVLFGHGKRRRSS